ncbi:MAG: LysM peptidoglycan-binding domain-containing protein [Candidatus Electrothrix sp. AUS4]|nr:LysM peptidoglycan-binding domain-containing protein [Candidatus Electrothrix sp. AUS4]
MQGLYQQVASLTTDLRMAQQQETEPAEQILCVLPGMEKASVEKEENSFAEDDPLVYEEDKERVASSGDDTKKDETTVSSVLQEEGGGQEESGEKQQGEQAGDILLAEGPLLQGGGEKEPAGEVSDAVESVPFVEPVLRKKRSSTLSEGSVLETKHASRVAGALLPEKQWTEKTFLYLVKETDTLWGLAERFYGNGKYYPVIMEQNSRLVISNIHDEESLRLFNDRSVLKELYSSRIEWRDGLTLWKHQVQTGETRQSIEKRFASPGDSDRVFYERKPDISPGAIVRVILH